MTACDPTPPPSTRGGADDDEPTCREGVPMTPLLAAAAGDDVVGWRALEGVRPATTPVGRGGTTSACRGVAPPAPFAVGTCCRGLALLLSGTALFGRCGWRAGEAPPPRPSAAPPPPPRPPSCRRARAISCWRSSSETDSSCGSSNRTAPLMCCWPAIGPLLPATTALCGELVTGMATCKEVREDSGDRGEETKKRDSDGCC